MRGSLVKEHHMETSVGPLHIQEYFSDTLGSPERLKGGAAGKTGHTRSTVLPPPAASSTVTASPCADNATSGFSGSTSAASPSFITTRPMQQHQQRYRPPHERAAHHRHDSFGSSNRSEEEDDDGGVFEFEMDAEPQIQPPSPNPNPSPTKTSVGEQPRRAMARWSPSLLDNQDWGSVLDPDRSYEITVVDDSGRRHIVDADHSGGLYAWTTVKILKDVLRRLLFPGARDIKLVVFFQRRELTNNAHTLLDCRIEDGAEIFVTQESDELASNVSLYGGYRPLPVLVELAFACSQGLRRGYRPQLAREGTGGTYYLFDSFKSRCAMFKPEDEESYAPNNPRGYVGKKHSTGFRPGILSGEGAVRECAAFLIDRDRFHNVPYTAMCSADAGEEAFHYADQVFRDLLSTNSAKRSKKIGALQEYVDAECDVGDMGVSLFSDLSVHKIGLLDVRIFNCDRNDGNILVQRDGPELHLIPIDHGLSLPSSSHMAVYWHEWAWLGWPQAKRPFDKETLAFIEAIDIDADCRVLKNELSIRDECILTLRISTLFLKVAAKAGLTLAAIGNMIARQKESEKSQLEIMMDQARVLASPTRVKNTMPRQTRRSRARSQPGSLPQSPTCSASMTDSPDSFGSGLGTPVFTSSMMSVGSSGFRSSGHTPVQHPKSGGASAGHRALNSPGALSSLDVPFSLGSPSIASSFASDFGAPESSPMQIPGSRSPDPFGIDFSMDFSVSGMMTPSLTPSMPPAMHGSSLVPHSLPMAAAEFPRSVPATSMVRSSTDEEYTRRSPLGGFTGNGAPGSIPRPALKRSSSTLRFSELNHNKAVSNLDSLPEMSWAKSADASSKPRRGKTSGRGGGATAAGNRRVSPSANRLSGLDLDSRSRPRPGLEIEHSSPFFFYLRELFESAVSRRKAQLVKEEAQRKARPARGGRFSRAPLATPTQSQQPPAARAAGATTDAAAPAVVATTVSSPSSSSSSTSFASESVSATMVGGFSEPNQRNAKSSRNGPLASQQRPSSSVPADPIPVKEGRDAEDEEEPNFYDQISFSPRPVTGFFRSHEPSRMSDYLLDSPPRRSSRSRRPK